MASIRRCGLLSAYISTDGVQRNKRKANKKEERIYHKNKSLVSFICFYLFLHILSIYLLGRSFKSSTFEHVFSFFKKPQFTILI